MALGLVADGGAGVKGAAPVEQGLQLLGKLPPAILAPGGRNVRKVQILAGAGVIGIRQGGDEAAHRALGRMAAIRISRSVGLLRRSLAGERLSRRRRGRQPRKNRQMKQKNSRSPQTGRGPKMDKEPVHVLKNGEHGVLVPLLAGQGDGWWLEWRAFFLQFSVCTGLWLNSSGRALHYTRVRLKKKGRYRRVRDPPVKKRERNFFSGRTCLTQGVPPCSKDALSHFVVALVLRRAFRPARKML